MEKLRPCACTDVLLAPGPNFCTVVGGISRMEPCMDEVKERPGSRGALSLVDEERGGTGESESSRSPVMQKDALKKCTNFGECI